MHSPRVHEVIAGVRKRMSIHTGKQFLDNKLKTASLMLYGKKLQQILMSNRPPIS